MSIGGTSAATVFVDVEGDLTKFRKDLDGAAKDTKTRFNNVTKAAGGAMVAAAVGIGVASAKTFVSFEKGIKEVYTLLPEASAAVRDQLAEDAKSVSTAFGQELGVVTTAMYDSISAGIPETEVKQFLTVAGQLAVGGATDIGIAVDGLTGVVNAYASTGLTAAQASDILFGTVKAGKTTVEELASKISNVTPIANELGLSFEQVGASLASVTSVTGNTAEASTQLRAILNELGKSGQKAFDNFGAATGQTFREFVAGGGTLVDALLYMQAHAEESELTLADMFGSVEAGGAALILAKEGGDKFNDTLAALEAGAGSTGAAFQEMEDTLSFRLDRIKAELSVAALNIGETIAPALTGFAEGISVVSTFLSELPGPIAAVSVGVLGLAGALLFLAGPILRAMQLIRMMTLLVSSNPYILIIAATILLAIIIVKNWDTITEKVREAAGAIDRFLTQWISEPAGRVAEIMEGLPEIFATAWDGAKRAVADAADFIVRKLGEMAAAADRALGPIDEILGFVVGGGAVKAGLGAFGIDVPGFDDGGVVPGRIGSPSLALVHGGETILPTHKDPNAGSDVYNISVEVTGSSYSEADGVNLVRTMQRELDATKRGRGRTDTARFSQ